MHVIKELLRVTQLVTSPDLEHSARGRREDSLAAVFSFLEGELSCWSPRHCSPAWQLAGLTPCAHSAADFCA